jgi:signal transduction histidine kinase
MIKVYLYDHLPAFTISGALLLLTYVLGSVMEITHEFLVAVLFLEGVSLCLIFLYDYLFTAKDKKLFFKRLEELDQKYLIAELVPRPDSHEMAAFYDGLYEITKSMNETISDKENEVKNFKEFIEMWIHEVKTPISALSLILRKDNNQKALLQLHRIENYTNEVLYYIRAQASTQDYVIKDVLLSDVVNKVLIKNKDELLGYGFKLDIDELNTAVRSDEKWLVFILDQIISNAIKYRKEHPYLKIVASTHEGVTDLMIEDHGKGIATSDLPRLFENSYTGINGHLESKSTGMGLFIVKKLCDALGHQVLIDSKEGEMTQVHILFHNNNAYESLMKEHTISSHEK